MSLNDEDIKQLIAILQKGLVSDEAPEDKPVAKRGRIKTTNSGQKNTQKKDKSINRFDQMMEKSLHKEDLAVDKLLSKYPPTARTREFSPVHVTCRVCGKNENINGALLTDAPNRYKCNKCSKEPG